jgi:uncharacterized protein YqjF (DUF2071 family)
MISRVLLSLILFVAGLFHIICPQLFDPAIPFAPKSLINICAGVLEIILAIGLWSKKRKDIFARSTALWFVFLIPVHIYVSLERIPMFGFDEPIFLWARTMFQLVLIFWALSLQDKGWIISQRWSDVLFLHYEVDSKTLQQKVPYPIDMYEGRAFVSIVPFSMGRIRFPFLPVFPFFSKLQELNLRTYVVVNGRPAVYFFTLDANHFIGVLIARTFFRLPYRWRSMVLNCNNDYIFESKNLRIKARIENSFLNSPFDLWATERYALVTKFLGMNLIGVVEHSQWNLKKVDLAKIEDNFSSEFIKLNNFVGASYSHSVDVRFRPFKTFKLLV